MLHTTVDRKELNGDATQMKSSTLSNQRVDNIPLSISVIIVTVLALSLGDALIKLTSNNFVIWQIFVVRSVIAIPILVIFMAMTAPSSLSLPIAMRWALLRSVLLMCMWVSYYVSLPHLTLSVAAAALYTLPIFITLFSAVIGGENISRVGWFAVFVGFAGVFLILKPNAADFNWYALLPLLSAILYAFAMILTRTKCQAEHPLLLSLTLNICFVVLGSIAAIIVAIIPEESRQGFLMAPWAELGLLQWVSMALLAIAILIGSIGTAIAYQNAPSSIIGIFDFAYVAFAVVWSVVIFGEIPDVLTLIGMALIVVAGFLSLRQSRYL